MARQGLSCLSAKKTQTISGSLCRIVCPLVPHTCNPAEFLRRRYSCLQLRQHQTSQSARIGTTARAAQDLSPYIRQPNSFRHYIGRSQADWPHSSSSVSCNSTIAFEATANARHGTEQHSALNLPKSTEPTARSACTAWRCCAHGGAHG